MKKVLFILAATALFASCASDETANQDATPKTEETTPAPAPAPEASQAPAPADTTKKAVDQKAEEMKKADNKAADQKAK